MNEWVVGTKIALSAMVGGVVASGMVDMPLRKKVIAVGAGMAIATFITLWLAQLSGLDQYATAFLIGLFGPSVCKLIFEGLQKSDISVKWADIIAAIRGK